jgi:hypothetical protein
MDFFNNIFGSEEEDELIPNDGSRDFLNSIGGRSDLNAGSDRSFLNTGGRNNVERDIPYRRNFFERVFAPFEGPQQATFSLIKNISEDGFQFRDIGDALGDGFLYANPFGNREPITGNEIGDILFGDRANKWADLGQGIAVSLLLDPLALVPLGRVAKLVGPGTRVDEAMAGIRMAAGQRVGAVTNRVVQAGERVVDRVTGTPGAGAGLTQTLGEAFVSKWFRTPDEFRQRVQNYQDEWQGLQGDAARIIRDSEKLGGVEGSRLMAEALQSEGFYMSAKTSSQAEGSVRAFEGVMNRSRDLGIHDEDFLRIYSNARELDDRVGKMIFDSGLAGAGEMEPMLRTHLRRRYRALDNPAEAVERLEALSMPSEFRFSQQKLYENLNAFRKELDPLFRPPTPKKVAAEFTDHTNLNQPLLEVREGIRALDGPLENLPGMQFFKDEDGVMRFQTRQFVEEFTEYTNLYPEHTLEEALEWVNNVMMEGVELPGKFNVSLANHLTGASFHTKTGPEVAETLRSALHSPAVEFYEFRDRIHKVAARQDLPPEVREVLGEYLEFQPRLAAQTSEAGLAAGTRQFLDDLAGVVRDPTDPTIVTDVAGSRLMGKTKEAIGPDAVQIVDNAFGEHINGMWVQPSVARHLQNVKRMVGTDAQGELGRRLLQTAENLTGTFKHLKVLMDPTAHARNMWGNMILADISGVNPIFNNNNLVKAVGELRSGGQGKYLKLAEEAGVNLFRNTFTRSELDTMAQALSRSTPKTPGDAMGAINQAFAKVGQGYNDATKFAGWAYNANESMFKMTAFMQRYDETVANLARRGKEITPELSQNIARKAAEFADRALFDYGDVPGIVDAFRRYGVVPFFTFPYKASLRSAEVLLTNPHRILKYPRMGREANEQFSPTPEQQRRSIESLPGYMRDSLTVKLPWNDGFGRDQYLDLSYFMPWASVRDLVESIPFLRGDAEVLPREGMFAPPAAQLVSALTNNETMNGQQIATPEMNAAQGAQAYADFLWEFMAPPSFIGGSRAKSLGRSMLAMAQSDPGPNPLLEYAGRRIQGIAPRVGEGGLDRQGRPPQTQASITGTSDDGTFSFLDVLQGAPATLAGLNTTASDPIRAARGVQAERDVSLSDLQSRRRQILNSNLSRDEKLRQIMILQEQMTELRQEAGDQLTRMFR